MTGGIGWGMWVICDAGINDVGVSLVEIWCWVVHWSDLLVRCLDCLYIRITSR